jgi:hypothetical protein
MEKAMAKACLLLSVVLLMLAAPAIAGSIQYGATDLGGGQWRYDYAVNGSFDGKTQGFTIYFDENLFSGLVNGVAGFDWDLFIDDPVPSDPSDPSITPAPGLFDALAQIDLSTGAYLFSVEFAWLSVAGAPGSQPLEFYTLDPSGVIIDQEFGFTQSSAPVPEPASFVLLSIGLAGAAWIRCFKKS